jgi:HlyD family secretion protein
MSRSWRRSLLWFVALGTLLGAGGFYWYGMAGREEPSQRYRKARVERGDLSFAVTATGTINPVVTVLVGSQVSGTIKALHADFNSLVKEEEVVAQIDSAIFEAQVEQAQANLQSARANVLNAQANLQNAQANMVKCDVAVVDARRTLDRNRELMAKGAVAQAALDSAQTGHDSAVATRDCAKAQIETAKAQTEAAKAQTEQARAALKVAETNLRYTTIRSPVNGIVISRNVDVGQTVAASLQAPTLFTIAKDLTEMQVDTNVSEADIGNILRGQDATFTVDAYPERTFRGKVSEIRNAPISVQNVVTYDVVVLVDNKDLKLKPGMTANVSILLAQREAVLKVSNAALRFQPEPSEKANGATAKAAETPRSGGSLLDRLAKELELTDGQRSQAEAILKASRGEFQTLRDEGKPEDLRKKIQSLVRQRIWGILTEAQRKRFEELSERSSQVKRGVPGRVWVPASDGSPGPVPLLLGITDGTFTEIVSGEVQEGTEVILEDTSRKKTASSSPSSPLSGRGLGR